MCGAPNQHYAVLPATYHSPHPNPAPRRGFAFPGARCGHTGATVAPKTAILPTMTHKQLAYEMAHALEERWVRTQLDKGDGGQRAACRAVYCESLHGQVRQLEEHICLDQQLVPLLEPAALERDARLNLERMEARLRWKRRLFAEMHCNDFDQRNARRLRDLHDHIHHLDSLAQHARAVGIFDEGDE